MRCGVARRPVLLTDNLRPGELTLYADKLPALLAAKRRFLANPEPGHTLRIEVRRKFLAIRPATCGRCDAAATDLRGSARHR